MSGSPALRTHVLVLAFAVDSDLVCTRQLLTDGESSLLWLLTSVSESDDLTGTWYPAAVQSWRVSGRTTSITMDSDDSARRIVRNAGGFVSHTVEIYDMKGLPSRDLPRAVVQGVQHIEVLPDNHFGLGLGVAMMIPVCSTRQPSIARSAENATDLSTDRMEIGTSMLIITMNVAVVPHVLSRRWI